jgi:hypothetical protein
MNRVLTIGAAIIILALAVYFLTQTEIETSLNVSPSLSPSFSPSATPTPTLSLSVFPTPVSNIKTYLSSRNGIRFQYASPQPNSTARVAVFDSGNQVYVYIIGTQATKGQYVQVYAKVANDSLAEAVRKQFSIDTNNCEINTDDNADYPDSYVVVTIQPKNPTTNCPRANVGGLSYFIFDQNKPDHFAYLSIGQYAILADDQKLWQNTLEFF